MNEQVRMCYMGSFISRDEAEVFEEEFFSFFGKDIEDGNLVIIEQKIIELNGKHVVRIMAENAQQELDLEEVEIVPVPVKSKLILPTAPKLIGFGGPVPTKTLELE